MRKLGGFKSHSALHGCSRRPSCAQGFLEPSQIILVLTKDNGLLCNHRKNMKESVALLTTACYLICLILMLSDFL